MTPKQIPCSMCGRRFPQEVLLPLDGEMVCPACQQEHTVMCSCCGQIIWRGDNAGSEELPLCENCREDAYTRCTQCGALIRNEDARYYRSDEYGDCPYCSHCFSEVGTEGINEYFYKPEPIFYGKATRFFGVELEVDGAGESNRNARRVLAAANQAEVERIYCKHDGSLDDGFEIVTHPMTLAYHEKEMPWKAVLDEVKAMGYVSHQAGTCGLHIHVNRNTFGSTTAQQDVCIARVLYFFEKHWEELLKFSRRSQRQLEQWAARYGYKEHPKEILDHAKKGGRGGRYSSVNLQNEDTIEFRIFRGTLKLNTLIATLQLVDRVCDVAFYLSDEELKAMSWTTFASGCTQPELVQYLKERWLYVNEPVEGEAEA